MKHFSKLSKLISYIPKKLRALLLLLLTAVVVPSVVLAWGPERPTYTIQNPAPHITFNSITNNPNYGDERNFVTIKDASNTNAGGWKDEISVQNNKEYLVRMYVHNNAADNLNLVAQNVVAKFNVPDYSAKRIQIDGYLSASNSSPKEIWDQAVFSSNDKFSLDYIEGSAKFTNNVFTSGTGLSDSVISSGAKLGYDKLDGKIPGCFKYDGFVTFKVKAVTSEFEVQKVVRLTDSKDQTFKETVTAKPGDKVDFQIEFKNTGGTQLKDVSIKDTLPSGLTYVKGSTWLHNSGGTRQVADGITEGGLNIGGYMPSGNAFLKFTAKVTSKDKLKCGTNNLVNKVKATTAVGSTEDTASVKVSKKCNPPEKCPVPGKEDLPKDDPDCYEIPPELPKTGIGETVAAVVGLGTLTASAGYYIVSRRKLTE